MMARSALNTPLRFPRWAGILLVAGLVVGIATLYAPGSWRTGDVDIYRFYALGFWHPILWSRLPAEYPPLSVLVFGLGLIGPPGQYADTFAAWMAVVTGLGYLAFRRWTSPQQAAAFAIYVLAAGMATVLFRFDVVPALVTVACLWLMQRNRFAIVYPLLAVATLTKLYPIVLLPVLVIAHWRAARNAGSSALPEVVGVVVCLGLIVLGFGVAVLIDSTHGLGAVTYDLRRPDEVEAVPSTLMWLGSLLGFGSVSANQNFGSFNLIGGMSTAANALGDGLLVVGMLFVYIGQFRGRFTTGQAALAALLILICTSKVLSAQYLIWLAPLLATTVGFQVRWLFVCLVNALLFPLLFSVGIDTSHGHVVYSGLLFGGIAVRNALLVACSVWFVVRPGTDQEEARITNRARGLPQARQPQPA